MIFNIITLFPQLFDGVFSTSMLYKAQTKGFIKVNYINLRDFGIGPRKQVDDTPYGGGDGMLLMPEPIFKAVASAKKISPESKVVLMTPTGERLKQSRLQAIAENRKDLIIICARYEGYDERVTSLVDYQISLGDFVLTGGEIPAMALVDGVARLLPGVLGGEQSAEIESFSDDKTLEFPQYTRPEDFDGLKVPQVLLSGNHAEIKKWRKDQQKRGI
jgi:tRNA (guanine37-N1)-methyltransferase